MKCNKQILEAINRGIQLALDDYEDDNQLSSKSNIIKNANAITETMEFVNQFIDLGLPSGTLWCKYNLGCNWDKLNIDPEHAEPKDWYGNYYAWGEIEPKKVQNYCWSTYKWAAGSHSNLLKYVSNEFLAGKVSSKYSYSGQPSVKFNDGLNELLPEDDAAYQNFYINNIHSRIPTVGQARELIDNTTYEVCENYNNIDYFNGIKLISKINGKEIFFPFTGYYVSDVIHHFLQTQDPGAYMWTSTLGTFYFEFAAYSLELMTNEKLLKLTKARYVGLPIRPVLKLW